MPTYDYFKRFLDDYTKMTRAERERFHRGIAALVQDLRRGEGFRPGLRVKRVRDAPPGVYEMTWAPDGRATFHYGREVHSGEPHIVWRRVGTHDVFRRP